MTFEMHWEDSTHHQALAALAEDVAAAGGRALLVGGSVRDAVLNFPLRDLDVEVYGLQPDSLISLLQKKFEINLVGKAFGVIKICHLPMDVSIPRRESKAGLGHRGFTIASDPTMAPQEAAARRDFTMNAMAWDPLTGELIDPFGGVADLQNRLLRHTSSQFGEDPLRVLRGMQFAARFDLIPAAETVALCSTMGLEGLAVERIFEEWRKLICLGRRPSRGLEFLRACGWIDFFPELKALIGCRQEKLWHPEGDVWTHTLHCLDAFAAERVDDDWENLVVGFAVLCHDFGKPSTTAFIEGRIRSRGHEEAGAAPTRSFLDRLTNQSDLADSVVPLVTNHLRPDELFRVQAGDSAVRRLARKVQRIDRLVRVARADRLGRPPLPDAGFPAGDWLLQRARELEVVDSAPKPLVMGRHLINLGLEPGPALGDLLETCYEAQLQGKFLDEKGGIAFVKKYLGSAGI